MTRTAQLNQNEVEISGRGAPVAPDYFAKHAEAENKHFVVLEKKEFDSEPEIVAHKEFDSYEEIKEIDQKKIGKELMEEKQ